MGQLNNQEIIQSIRSGNQDAFKKAYYLYFQEIYKTTYRLCRDSEEAKDLTQSTFIKFWEKRKEVVIQTTLEGYLKKMAVNLALAEKRKTVRRKEKLALHHIGEEQHNGVEQHLEHAELEERVRNSIEALPEKCKTIFKLSRMEGMTYREISNQLNLSPKTVENQMGIALKRLRHSLVKYLQFIFF